MYVILKFLYIFLMAYDMNFYDVEKKKLKIYNKIILLEYLNLKIIGCYYKSILYI